MFKSFLLTSFAIGISAATISLPAQAKWPTYNQVDVRDHREKRLGRNHRSQSRKQVRDHRTRNRVQDHRRPRRSNEKVYAQSGNKWGSTFSAGRSYNNPKPTLVACKRAMSGAGGDRSKTRSKKIAIKRWGINATNRYGSPASWGAAKNRRVTCRFNRSQAAYKCKAIANPCFRGTGQNRQ